MAATRARQMLVVSRWTGKANNGAWRVLDGFLGKARELSVPAAVTAPAVVPQDCSMAVQTAAAEARETGACAREPAVLVGHLGHGGGATHRAHDAFGRCLG